MRNDQLQFKERTSICFPEGTGERIRRVAMSRGMTAATFIRTAVLDRLRFDENTAGTGAGHAMPASSVQEDRVGV